MKLVTAWPENAVSMASWMGVLYGKRDQKICRKFGFAKHQSSLTPNPAGELSYQRHNISNGVKGSGIRHQTALVLFHPGLGK
jgi:hypothetical protein